LLLIFKLSGSYIGVFSSKDSTEHEKSGELFMFSLNSRTDRSIGLARQKYFKIDPTQMGIEDQLSNGEIQY
jgi:hypothetical protein